VLEHDLCPFALIFIHPGELAMAGAIWSNSLGDDTPSSNNRQCRENMANIRRTIFAASASVVVAGATFVGVGAP
jgi:hypothetical protein